LIAAAFWDIADAGSDVQTRAECDLLLAGHRYPSSTRRIAVPRLLGVIRPVAALRHDALQAHPAGVLEHGADVGLKMPGRLDKPRLACAARRIGLFIER